MKKSKTFWPAHFLVLLAGCISSATAAPFGPNGHETQWTQPNGEVVKLRMFGDDSYARTETLDGFTLVFNEDTNTYEYAKLSPDGKSFVCTGVRADQQAPDGLEPHIDLPNAEIRDIAKIHHEKFDKERNQRWQRRVDAVKKARNAPKGAAPGGFNAAPADIQAAPVVGSIRGLTILVQFPDDPATNPTDRVNFPTNRAKIVRFCNGVGYQEDGNSGSVRDYYADQSLAKLDYTQTVTEIVTLPHPRNYYNYSDYPANQTLYVDIDVSANNMINDAVAILKSRNFDFTSLTVDANGLALATNVFFAGPDSGRFARGLWPHQYHTANPVDVGTPTQPISLYNYEITNIDSASPVIGTFCHENGHLILDYPDIYAVGSDGEGVGEHCLMGSGNYLNDGKTPAPINAYFKDLVGWAKVTDLKPTDHATKNLPTTGNVAYRISNPAAPSEYFVVENRGAGDKWAQYADDKGIIIWHVDEAIEGNTRGGPHYGIAMEQADGRMDLENSRNRGDKNDCFDLNTPKFTDSTTPDARWWDGSKSSVDVEVLSGVGKSTTVAFGGIPPNTLTLTSPNGGEIIFKDAVFPITWKSNISGNVKIDLLRDGAFFRNLSSNEIDDGSYDWAVAKDLKGDGNYAIRISTLTNPVFVSDTSDQTFAITAGTFPLGNRIPDGWFKPGFAQTQWAVTKKVKFEGSHSIGSVRTSDGRKSAIGFRSKFKAGVVSFYMKVSSEDGFDFAKFYIDGVSQALPGASTTKGMSGDVDWQFVQFPVAAGKHTFIWSYEKDDSYAGLKDAAWIDGVTLPPGTQEIAVQSPKGNNLVDGLSTRTFSPVTMGQSSRPMTFTIVNRGSAILSGLAIKTSGRNSSEFRIGKFITTRLEPGKKASFTVTFAPKDFGPRNAVLSIFSNDFDEGKFDIDLAGTGLGLPKIAVNQPTSKPLKDGDSKKFGIALVGSQGNSKVFTITNTGSAILKKLEIRKSGANRKDFKVGNLGVPVLDPGDSTTFRVTFNPKGRNERKALLRIFSNDKPASPFEIRLVGKGAPRGKRKAAATLAGNTSGSASDLAAALGTSGKDSAAGISTTTTLEVVDGEKYLALTVPKLADGSPAGVVEVSPNLLDWYSGSKHTTVLIDDATTLKVRDNTPYSQQSKRYIRLK